MKSAEAKTPALPVKALKVFLGAEKFFPHLLRSDHSPFWQMNVPALMWTDTFEFRNPHYHRRSDLPDTLNYDFMTQVCNLLVETIVRTCSRSYCEAVIWYQTVLNILMVLSTFRFFRALSTN